jgi:hypothetical protein
MGRRKHGGSGDGGRKEERGAIGRMGAGSFTVTHRVHWSFLRKLVTLLIVPGPVPLFRP